MLQWSFHVIQDGPYPQNVAELAKKHSLLELIANENWAGKIDSNPLSNLCYLVARVPGEGWRGTRPCRKTSDPLAQGQTCPRSPRSWKIEQGGKQKQKRKKPALGTAFSSLLCCHPPRDTDPPARAGGRRLSTSLWQPGSPKEMSKILEQGGFQCAWGVGGLSRRPSGRAHAAMQRIRWPSGSS